MTDDQNTMSAEQLQAQLDAVYASTSWKITAPLRLFGKGVITSKNWLRQAVASPRAAARRSTMALMRGAVAMIKNSPLMMRMVTHVRRKYPRASRRFISQLPPAIGVTTPSLVVPRVVVTCDPPYAWSSAMSQTGHFKQMLSHELQQRQNKKSEHQ